VEVLNLHGAALLPTLLVGLVLGFKHSLEADHVVAVSTLVARENRWRRSLLLGAWWGLGHTATLLVVGALIAFLRVEISARVLPFFDGAVAVMLIFLGARVLWQWRRGDGHFCRHRHGDIEHAHFHRHGQHACAAQEHEEHLHHSHKRRESFLVGAVHGLNGSAALMLLVLATIPQPLWALCYVLLFGLGSIGGMCLISAVFSASTAFAGRRFERLGGVVQGVCGAASLCFGIYLAAQLGAA
jgi:ABC-type nickel/cobalt efflux system permease component RcnA